METSGATPPPSDVLLMQMGRISILSYLLHRIPLQAPCIVRYGISSRAGLVSPGSGNRNILFELPAGLGVPVPCGSWQLMQGAYSLPPAASVLKSTSIGTGTFLSASPGREGKGGPVRCVPNSTDHSSVELAQLGWPWECRIDIAGSVNSWTSFLFTSWHFQSQ